jgi:hypothetical protein
MIFSVPPYTPARRWRSPTNKPVRSTSSVSERAYDLPCIIDARNERAFAAHRKSIRRIDCRKRTIHVADESVPHGKGVSEISRHHTGRVDADRVRTQRPGVWGISESDRTVCSPQEAMLDSSYVQNAHNQTRVVDVIQYRAVRRITGGPGASN